jgi:hypothetical protein
MFNDIKSGVRRKFSLSVANQILIFFGLIIGFCFSIFSFKETIKLDNSFTIESRLNLLEALSSQWQNLKIYSAIRTLFATLKQADKHCNYIGPEHYAVR